MWILVEWTEEKLFSIISFKSIETPRREYKDYKENDSVQAKFGGKLYPARIIQKSESKVHLDKKLGELGSGTIGRKTSKTTREKPIESDSHPPGVVGTGQATPETTREMPIESDSHPLGVVGTGQAAVLVSQKEPVTEIQPVHATQAPRASAATAAIGELDADDAPDYMTDRTARPNTDTKRSDSRKIQEVEEEVHCLRKKLRKLEDRMVRLEQALKDSMGPEKPLTEMEQLKLELDNFLSDNEHNILKFLAMKVFTKEDLMDRSLSGKKSAKSVETARLPLDQAKLNMLEQLFKYRCPSTTRKMFVEKLQNIQKVMRRESKK